MTRYELRRLLRRARGSQIRLPRIEESAGGRAAYLKALRAMMREMVPIAREARGQVDLELLARTALLLTDTAKRTVNEILRLESRRHTETFIAGARRALGVDLRAVVRDEDLAGFLSDAAFRNAGLIKNLSDDAVSRISQTVMDGVLSGSPRADVQRRLTENFGILDRRAKLIAQDQMAKLNADLNRERHLQAGVLEYEWSTSRDERVRPRHRALDGKIYRYGEPTAAEGGLPPGKPVRCRCVAIGIVQF